MKRHQVEQNSDAWMELRGKFRTASQAAIVCGVSPFTKPEDFKLIQAGLKKQFYSKAMQLGHELEDQVRTWANGVLERTFEPQTWSHGKYMASLDGIAGDELVEIKVSSHTYNSLADGVIPDYYWLQIQQQLHCSPAKTGYLVAYCPKTNRYACSEPIAEDPAAMERIEEAWEAFDAMPIPEGPIDRTDDGTVVTLFEEYAHLKREVEAAKNRMDVIRDQLVVESQGHGMIANGYKLTMRQGAARVDYKKACTDAKIDTDPYKSYGKPTWAVTLPKSPFEVVPE